MLENCYSDTALPHPATKCNPTVYKVVDKYDQNRITSSNDRVGWEFHDFVGLGIPYLV